MTKMQQEANNGPLLNLHMGDKVYFANEYLHAVDDTYPPAGAEGTFQGYSRPDRSRAWVQWEEGATRGDGFWACHVDDLAILNQAVGA